jgi:hypothetical protein
MRMFVPNEMQHVNHAKFDPPPHICNATSWRTFGWLYEKNDAWFYTRGCKLELSLMHALLTM